MVRKAYDWKGGAALDEHSKRKHKILREYFAQYLTVRCSIPRQSQFRLAIVDGFCGGGIYKCGSKGSPVIFIEELRYGIERINLNRASQGLGALEIECLLIFNDAERDAIELLKDNIASLLGEIAQNVPKLHLRVECLSDTFEGAFYRIKELLQIGRFPNTIFNLDQYGHSRVELATLRDIMNSFRSPEIFYTFSIQSLISFLHQFDREKLLRQLSPFGLKNDDLGDLDPLMSKAQWLSSAERLVFETFKGCASYVTPFSIHNPKGWRYWFIHFANNYRARQVYNNVLHGNSSAQAHFGRSGLQMLSFDPSHETGSLYLFDDSGRAQALQQLMVDIPRIVADSGDAMKVLEFYQATYNETPAHADDIHKAIIENPELEVLTPAGGERRKANTIDTEDILKLKSQRSFFPLFIKRESTIE
ncbi:three-Cys-motif partner protein TcmP [Dongia sp.]|uniref:three-Cys-motif partner protein TcmP n=1 Tax=Dongia sp. TaxID=1977262 RepID=UPI0035B1558C